MFEHLNVAKLSTNELGINTMFKQKWKFVNISNICNIALNNPILSVYLSICNTEFIGNHGFWKKIFDMISYSGMHTGSSNQIEFIGHNWSFGSFGIIMERYKTGD